MGPLRRVGRLEVERPEVDRVETGIAGDVKGNSHEAVARNVAAADVELDVAVGERQRGRPRESNGIRFSNDRHVLAPRLTLQFDGPAEQAPPARVVPARQ